MGDTIKKSPLLSVARKATPVHLIPIVQLISCWAAFYAIPAPRPEWYLSLTGAAAVVAGVLDYGQLCCCVLQAVAGLLVPPLLKGRRRRTRWAVAFVALVVTTANHCIWAMIEGVSVVFYTGGLLSIVAVLTAVIMIGVSDIAAFVVLFKGEDQEIYGSA